MAGGIDLVDGLLEEGVVEFEFALAELLGGELVPEAGGDLLAGRVGGVDDRDGVGGLVPGEGEEAEALVGVLRVGDGEGAEAGVADLDAGLGGVAGEGEEDELGAALVDVVLEGVGGDAGRLQVDDDVVGLGGLRAAKVVGGGGDSELGRAADEAVAGAGLELQGVGRRSQVFLPEEEAVGGELLGGGEGSLALRERGRDAPDTVLRGDPGGQQRLGGDGARGGCQLEHRRLREEQQGRGGGGQGQQDNKQQKGLHVFRVAESGPRTEGRGSPFFGSGSGVDARGFVAERLDVFVVGARVDDGLAVRAGFATEFEHARGEALEEEAVVGDEDHRAFEVV